MVLKQLNHHCRYMEDRWEGLDRRQLLAAVGTAGSLLGAGCGSDGSDTPNQSTEANVSTDGRTETVFSTVERATTSDSPSPTQTGEYTPAPEPLPREHVMNIQPMEETSRNSSIVFGTPEDIDTAGRYTVDLAEGSRIHNLDFNQVIENKPGMESN